jgi:hypothetical protein
MNKKNQVKVTSSGVVDATQNQRVWEVFDGDVRLSEDGTVQHLDNGKWKDGWGEWARFPQDELRPRDVNVIRKWKRAVEARQVGTADE